MSNLKQKKKLVKTITVMLNRTKWPNASLDQHIFIVELEPENFKKKIHIQNDLNDDRLSINQWTNGFSSNLHHRTSPVSCYFFFLPDGGAKAAVTQSDYTDFSSSSAVANTFYFEVFIVSILTVLKKCFALIEFLTYVK